MGECNYADYFVSRGIPIPVGWGVGQATKGMAEEEDVEQKVKDVVPLIMAKQQLLNGLDNNEEMKEIVKIMGKIHVLCRMILFICSVCSTHDVFSGYDMSTLLKLVMNEIV